MERTSLPTELQQYAKKKREQQQELGDRIKEIRESIEAKGHDDDEDAFLQHFYGPSSGMQQAVKPAALPEQVKESTTTYSQEV